MKDSVSRELDRLIAELQQMTAAFAKMADEQATLVLQAKMGNQYLRDISAKNDGVEQ